MRLRSILTGKAAVYTAASAVLIVAVFAISLQTRWVSKGFVKILENSVNKYLDTTPGLGIYRVEIGSADTPSLIGSGAGSFVIRERISGATAFKAAYVKIKYNPLRLLFKRGDYTKAISGVELIDPTLYVKKDVQGKWNIARLFMGGGSKGPGFLANADFKVGIRRGRIYVPGLPPLDRLNAGVEGSIKLKRGSIVFDNFDISGLKGKAEIAGRLSLTDGISSEVTARLNGFSIQEAFDKAAFKGTPPVKGDLRGIVKLRGRYPELRVSYDLNADNGAVYFQGGVKAGIDSASAAGSYEIGSDTARVNRLALSTGSTGLRLSGTVGLSGRLKMTGSLRTSNPKADLPGVARLLRLNSGRISSRVSVGGTVKNPEAVMDIMASSCLVAGVPVTGIEGRVKLDKSSVEFTESSTRLFGQTVLIGGRWIYAGKDKLTSRITLKAPELDLGRVAKDFGYKDLGSGRLALASSFTRGAGGIAINGYGSSRSLNIKGVNLSRVSFSLAGTPESIRIDNGMAAAADGSLSFGGSIGPEGFLDIKIQSNELQLAPLTALTSSLDSAGISGVASGYTHLSGNVKKPKLAGVMSISSLTVADRGFDSLNFNYTIAENKIGLNRIRVGNPEEAYSGDANITMRSKGGAQLDGEFRIKDQPLGDLLSLVSGSRLNTSLFGERFNGRVNGRIKIGGDMTRPVISVAVGPNGITRPIPLTAKIDLEYKDGRIRIAGVEPFKS